MLVHDWSGFHQNDEPEKLMDVLYLTTVRLDEVLAEQGQKKARRQDT
jgi:hypothetical protein